MSLVYGNVHLWAINHKLPPKIYNNRYSRRPNFIWYTTKYRFTVVGNTILAFIITSGVYITPAESTAACRWDTIGKLASLLLSLHSDPLQTLLWGNSRVLSTKNVQILGLIGPPVRLGARRQLLLTELDRHLSAGVVNYCKRSATLGICCSQSSSVYSLLCWRQSRTGGFYSQCEILVFYCTIVRKIH